MKLPSNELPYIDEHAIRIPASRELVWTALQQYVETSMRLSPSNPLVRLLGAEPPEACELSESTPAEHLTLVGHHRFSQYMLAFELTDAINGTTHLRAQTYAVFPGILGRVYRALVIDSRAHVVATNHVLRSVKRMTIDLAKAAR